MIRLVEVIHDRKNNFHLLRLVAASAVLFSHSFPITTGDLRSEPLRARFGCTPGSIAVDLFFLISGLLVTMSLVRRNSVMDFVRARFFRIWPGLIVAVALTVFLLGPAITTLSLGSYLSSWLTWRYAIGNTVLFHGVVWILPGVFTHNPYPDAVNGSLWSLPLEIRCYLFLLAAWICIRKPSSEAVFKAFVAALLLGLLGWHGVSLAHGSLEDSPARLYLMFTSGVAAYLFRDRIRLSAAWLAAGSAIVALATLRAPAFGLAYSLVLPYAMLCFAYLPRGAILKFNGLGDYSYGVYIYAYPVQQTLTYLFPRMGVATAFPVGLGVTLILAIISWHFIEKPALALARAPLLPISAKTSIPSSDPSEVA